MREVRRFCATSDVGIARRIHGNVTGNIVTDTSQVSRINQPVTSGIELRDENITEICVSAVGGRVIRIPGWKIPRDSLAHDEHIPVGVNCHFYAIRRKAIESELVTCTTKVSGINESRINDKWHGRIISTDFESNSLMFLESKTGSNWFPPLRCLL